MSVLSIFKFVSVWIIVLPFITGIIFYRKLNTDSKIILLVVFAGIIPEIIGGWFFHNEEFRNITYNLYTPVEFGCYAMLFRNKFILYKLKQLYKISLLFYSLISLYLLLNNKISTLFLNQWVITGNIILLCWIGLYLIQLYWKDDIEFEPRDPFFWFLIAIICYASSTTVFYSLWYIVLSKAFSKYYFVVIIHHIFNINLYLLFFVGILKNVTLHKFNEHVSR